MWMMGALKLTLPKEEGQRMGPTPQPWRPWYHCTSSPHPCHQTFVLPFVFTQGLPPPPYLILVMTQLAEAGGPMHQGFLGYIGTPFLRPPGRAPDHKNLTKF